MIELQIYITSISSINVTISHIGELNQKAVLCFKISISIGMGGNGAKLLGSLRNDSSKQLEGLREENSKFLVSVKSETSKIEEQVKGVRKLALIALIASIISIAAPFIAKFL